MRTFFSSPLNHRVYIYNVYYSTLSCQHSNHDSYALQYSWFITSSGRKKGHIHNNFSPGDHLVVVRFHVMPYNTHYL